MRKKQSHLPGRVALAGALAAACLAAACAAPRHGRLARGGWREEGLASWYGRDFHGRQTANGERYNMYAMTAAHKTLPLGTWVTVTDKRTGHRVRVRINDRGPFVAGRIIDLSYGAARRLGSAEAGVVPVVVEADLPASAYAPERRRRPEPRPAAAPPPPAARPAPPAAAPPPPALRGSFTIQVGAVSVEDNARHLRERIGGDAHVVPYEDNRGRWWRVRVGRYDDEEEAREAAARLAGESLPGFVVRED